MHSEKAILRDFRTGVRLPSPPPARKAGRPIVGVIPIKPFSRHTMGCSAFTKVFPLTRKAGRPIVGVILIKPFSRHTMGCSAFTKVFPLTRKAGRPIVGVIPIKSFSRHTMGCSVLAPLFLQWQGAAANRRRCAVFAQIHTTMGSSDPFSNKFLQNLQERTKTFSLFLSKGLPAFDEEMKKGKGKRKRRGRARLSVDFKIKISYN